MENCTTLKTMTSFFFVTSMHNTELQKVFFFFFLASNMWRMWSWFGKSKSDFGVCLLEEMSTEVSQRQRNMYIRHRFVKRSTELKQTQSVIRRERLSTSLFNP